MRKGLQNFTFGSERNGSAGGKGLCTNLVKVLSLHCRIDSFSLAFAI